MKKLIGLLGVVILGVLALAVGATSAGATKPPDHKITICHATDSYSNPYVIITVDVASTHFAGHEGHLGPIFYSAIPKHTKWGDIIPPTSNDGTRQVTPRNWPAGQSILENGCKLPSPTTTTTQPCDCTTTTGEGTTTTTQGTTTTLPGTTTTMIPGTTTTMEPPTTVGPPPRRLPRPPSTGSTTLPPVIPTPVSPSNPGSPGSPLANTGIPSGLLYMAGSGLLGLGLFLVRKFRPLTRG